MNLRVDVSGPLRKLRRMEERLSPAGLTAVGARLSGLVHRESFQAFDTSSDPVTGAPWPPRKYTPQTTWRARRGKLSRQSVKPWKLLIKTGTLRRGVAGKFDVQQGKVAVLGVVSGLAAKYAAAHQLGIGVPVRRFLGLGREAIAKARAIIAEHLSS